MATTPHMSLWVIPGVSLCNSQLALKVFFFFLLGEFDNQVWEWFNSPLTLANLQGNSCRKQTNKQAHNSMQHQSGTPNKAIRSSTFGFGLANTGDWGEGAVKQTPELCHSLGKVHDSLINLPVRFRNMWKNSYTKANFQFMFKDSDVQ